MLKKVDVMESSSKSQNIQFDESIKSPITKKRKISTHQIIVKQKKLNKKLPTRWLRMMKLMKNYFKETKESGSL